MNDAAPEEERLLDEAIDLMISHQGDPDNAGIIDRIMAWRAVSDDHERIWNRVAKIHGASGRILSEKKRIERRDALQTSRRNFMIGAAATVGAGATAYLFGPGLLLEARADYLTGKGEFRRIELADGSVAILGPQSALAVDFGKQQRAIRLLAGMTFLWVAPLPGAPLSVMAGPLRAASSSGAFDISSDGDYVTVGVDDGRVNLSSQRRQFSGDEELRQGDWLSFDASSGAIGRGRRERDMIGSWRDNLIIAENEPVSALALRIGRWIPGRIVIADPFIGSRYVSGVFDLDRPFSALEAAVHPANAKVRRISSLLTIVSPV
ncbi:UNVERIFIED_ORG: FecR family protein [Martelella mediterranea]